MELNTEELNEIVGGSVSGAILSSVIKGVNLLFEIGRSFGSSIRRLVTKKYC